MKPPAQAQWEIPAEGELKMLHRPGARMMEEALG